MTASWPPQVLVSSNLYGGSGLLVSPPLHQAPLLHDIPHELQDGATALWQSHSSSRERNPFEGLRMALEAFCSEMAFATDNTVYTENTFYYQYFTSHLLERATVWQDFL